MSSWRLEASLFNLSLIYSFFAVEIVAIIAEKEDICKKIAQGLKVIPDQEKLGESIDHFCFFFFFLKIDQKFANFFNFCNILYICKFCIFAYFIYFEYFAYFAYFAYFIFCLFYIFCRLFFSFCIFFTFILP